MFPGVLYIPEVDTILKEKRGKRGIIIICLGMKYSNMFLPLHTCTYFFYKGKYKKSPLSQSGLQRNVANELANALDNDESQTGKDVPAPQYTNYSFN